MRYVVLDTDVTSWAIKGRLTEGDGGGVGGGAGRMLLVAVRAGRWAVAEAPAGFGSLLRRLRREAGWTQEELAEAAGLSVRAVAYLERGR
jgi:hypothetical protein